MLLCDVFCESCCYQASRCLYRLGVRRAEATSTLCHAGKANTFPDVLPVLPIAGAFLQQSFSYCIQQSPVQHTHMQVPTSDLDRTTILSKRQSSPKIRLMNSLSLATLAEKAGEWQMLQTMCQKDSWFLLMLRILVLPGMNHIVCFGSEQE